MPHTILWLLRNGIMIFFYINIYFFGHPYKSRMAFSQRKIPEDIQSGILQYIDDTETMVEIVEFHDIVRLAALRPVARPLYASREARLSCSSLRAAYSLAAWQTAFVHQRKLLPACDHCGAITSNWCEQCNQRRPRSWIRAICNLCESSEKHRSCKTCIDRNSRFTL